MKILLTLVLGTFALSCGGGGGGTLTQAEACPQIAQAACDKIYSCSDATLLLAQALLMTKANCVATVQPTCPSMCPTGQTYHGDKAKACVDAAKGASCATVAANISTDVQAIINAVAPVCNEICTP